VRYTKAERQEFPKVFCIEEVRCMPAAAGGYDYRAALYHDYACITVSFNAARRDPRLKKGCIVSIDWAADIESRGGAIKVNGLCVRSCSALDFNPFLNVPRTWKKMDRHLIHCARDLWDIAPKALRRLLAAMLDANAERR
jgi:hypothetical protein